MRIEPQSQRIHQLNQPHFVRRFLRGSAIVMGTGVAALCWLVLMLWMAGRILTDRFLWTQWLWWTPTIAIVFVGLLGMTSSLRPARTRRRKKRRMIAWLIVELALVLYFVTVEHRWLWHTPAVPASATVSILHWNLAHPSPRQTSIFADELSHIDGDIIVLTSPGSVLREEPVREHFKQYPVIRFLGIFSIVSRYEFMGARTLRASDRIFITLAQFDTSATLGRPLMVYLIDLPSEIWIPRMEVAHEVRRILDRAEAPPADLIIGDFNIPAGSASLDVMFPGYTEAWTEAGSGIGASWPRTRPIYRIDLTLISPALRAIDCQLLDPGIGQHRVQSTTVTARNLSSN